jgi:hypothetical protein
VGQVTAVAWPAQLSIARELAQIAGRPAEWPGLGTVEPGPIRLIVVPNARVLDSLTAGRAPSWGAAVALPQSHTILLRADIGDLRQTLRHELAHLALHRMVQGRVPLWFDEGYAGWAAGEWSRFGSLELNLAVVRGGVPDLRDLDGSLRGVSSTADAAYGLAVSAVVELANRNPTGTLDPLLAALRSGVDFDEAVLRTTGLTAGRFGEEWQRAVKRRYSFGVWLVAGGGWVIVALVMVGLVQVRRRRDRPRRAALDIGWEVEPEDTEGSELDRTP